LQGSRDHCRTRRSGRGIDPGNPKHQLIERYSLNLSGLGEKRELNNHTATIEIGNECLPNFCGCQQFTFTAATDTSV
jgi:hypothetical protein